MQWSEPVGQEAGFSTKRSSKSSIRRQCLHFRPRQVETAKCAMLVIDALKEVHLGCLRHQRALGSLVFQTEVVCWLIKNRSASHLQILSAAWTLVLRTEVKRWLSMVCATMPPLWGEPLPPPFWHIDAITGALWCALGNSSLAYEKSVSDNNLVSVSYVVITCLRSTHL
jgi:hypothetical protein